MDNENFTVDFGEVTNVGGGGTSDFNELTNRPKYDSNTMSGDTNIPKVPSKTSDLTNDSDYQTETEVSDAISTAIGAISIPTKTSDLTNDGADGQSTYVETDELAAVATSGSYNDLEDKPSIPTYSDFTGTDGTSAGAAGLVPAPTTADVDKFLKSDGTWEAAGGGGGGDTVYSDKSTSNSSTGGAVYIGNLDTNQEEQADPTTTDNHYKYFWALPASNASTPAESSINILGNNPATQGICLGLGTQSNAANYYSISVGLNANTSANNAHSAIAFGTSTNSSAENSIAFGRGSQVSNSTYKNSVALGSFSQVGRKGEVNVGTGGLNMGYNGTDYRVIGGVHDPIDAHDAATKGYVDAHSGGGGGAIELTSADYNYDTNGGTNYNSIALWLLPDNIYKMPDASVSMTGATNGTSYEKFNTAINGRHFQYFLKFGTRFWFFADGSNTIPEIGTGAMVYLCTLRTSDGRFSFDLNKQLATKGDLSA